MGLWTGIKHAINSSLGTNDFKPLDKIIRDSYYVYASDDLLKVLCNEEDRSDVEADIPLTDVATINVPGVIKLKAVLSGHWDGTYLRMGTSSNLLSIRLPNDKTYTNYVVEKEIEVKKGDVLQIEVDLSKTYRDALNNIKVTANGKIGSAPDTGIFIE